MTIRAVVYEKDTGETKSDCGLYEFDCFESLRYHMLQANLSNRGIAEITPDEYCELAEFDSQTNTHPNKVDINKIKFRIKDREREEYEIHSHGISYTDMRPIKAIEKR